MGFTKHIQVLFDDRLWKRRCGAGETEQGDRSLGLISDSATTQLGGGGRTVESFWTLSSLSETLEIRQGVLSGLCSSETL